MKTRKALTIVAFIVLLAGAAFAQQRPMAGPMGGQYSDDETSADPGSDRTGPPSEKRREAVRKKMEAVRIMRLTETLKLDEETAAKFIPLITSLEQKRRDLIRENQQAMRELREYLASKNPDEKKLKSVMEKMGKTHQEMMKIREKEIEAAKGSLTIEQQAKYLLFQQDFMREMRGMISGARGGMGSGRGPGMGGGKMRGGPGQPPAD
jgi:Spy/CpxP family protein refolding chaperone